MIKTFLTVATLLMLTSPALTYAETCPTPLELSAGNYDLWQPRYLDDASPLTDQQRAEFQTKVKHFALAEWMEFAPEGSAHCYYEGDTPDGSYLNTYLTKDNLKPLSRGWKRISDDLMQCTLDLGLCLFDVT